MRVRILTLAATLGVMAGCRNESSRSAEPSLPERTGLIQRKGIPMTLLGPELKPGSPAPAFTAVDTAMELRSLEEFRGKVVVISSIPSLDTPVCNLQTLRFNTEAERLAPDVVILTISADLPFAQKRWCDDAGVDKVICLSDYRDRAFGKAYGLIIKERMLLARAVVVIDRQGVVRYAQIVEEQFREPDYDAALSAVKDALALGAAKPGGGAGS